MNIKMSSTLTRQYLAVFTVNLSVLTTGMSMAWPSPVLVKLSNPTETPLVRPVTAEEASWMVSLGFLFGVLSDIVGGMLMDTIGRKKCLILSSLPKLAMAILLIFANKSWMLIFGRTVMITSDCFVYMIVPIYTSELAEKVQRGALGSFLQLFSSLGALISLAVGPFTSYKTFNIIFAGVIALTSLILLWLPDSPFFLYKTGNMEETFKILSKIRDSDAIIKEEIEEYKDSCAKLHQSSEKVKLLKNKVFMKSLALGVLMCVGVQFIGFNAVTAYMQSILESTQTNVRPETASVIIGVLEVFVGFSSIFITNIFRRRTILMWSLTGLFLGTVGMGAFFQITDVEHHEIKGFLNYLPLVSLILIICCYCVGIGCLIWPIIAEIFDSHTRAFGVSTCLISTTTLIFVMTKFFSTMNTYLGSAGTFWFFSTMTVILMLLLGIFLPETKDKTFNEIQIALGETSKKMGTYAENKIGSQV